MSGSVTFSQTGVAARVVIVAGPDTTLSGAVAGPGFTAATLGVDGHLRITGTDGSVTDLGRIAPTVGRLAPAGTTQANAAPIVATTTILVPGSAGGGVILPGPGRWEIINRAGADVPIFPNPGGAIEQSAANIPVPIANGEVTVLASPDALVWSAT